MAVHTHVRQLTPEQVAPPASIDKMRRLWFGVGGVGILISLGLLLLNFRSENGIQQFMRAYLVGFMLCSGLTLGCMALLMLYHVVGGKWGVVVMRMFEAGTRNWPVMVLMFVPIALSLKYIYPWANPGTLGLHGQHAQALHLTAPGIAQRLHASSLAEVSCAQTCGKLSHRKLQGEERMSEWEQEGQGGATEGTEEEQGGGYA